MKAAIVGCGPMGRAAVHALLTDPDGAPDAVIVIDRDPARLAELRAGLGGRLASLVTHVGDAGERDTLKVLAGVDVIGTASSWADAAAVTEFAVRRGIAVAGIGRPPADPKDLLGAVRGPAILGTGVEPGLIEVLARRLLDSSGPCAATHVQLFCGGVPADPRPPLRHVAWFGPAKLPDPRPAFTVRAGRLFEVERFGDVELVEVPGLGILEAFTDALLPWVVSHPVFGELSGIEQKTLRWPGFANAVTTLRDLGLLADRAIEVAGTSIGLRAVVDAALVPALARRDGDRDMTVLAVQISSATSPGGAAGSHLVLGTDPDTGLTGMARLTATMLAETMRRLREPDLPAGVIPAWEAFAGTSAAILVERLRRRGIEIVDHPGRWLVAAEPAPTADPLASWRNDHTRFDPTGPPRIASNAARR